VSHPVDLKQPPFKIPSRTDFLGQYRFPAEDRAARTAELRELRELCSWSHHDVEMVDGLYWRVKDLDDHVRYSVQRAIGMIREACIRGAKYERAADLLGARCDELEKENARLAAIVKDYR
jgi:hypothetical protein